MPISGRSHRIVLQIPRSLDYGNEDSLWLQDARFDNKQIIRISCILQSVRWNLLTPKIIRIESLSVWRDNERKPRILLLNYGWASNDGKGSKQIHHRYELVWGEVTASTGLSWNVSSRLHWQTRRHILRNTFNLKARLYRIRQYKHKEVSVSKQPHTSLCTVQVLILLFLATEAGDPTEFVITAVRGAR